MGSASKLDVGDLVVITVYFVFILLTGLWTSRQNRGSAHGYFLAGRSMNWVLVGASLFASNIGSLHFVGLAGSGAAAGLSIGMYEINAIFVLMLLGYIFLPVYISSGVFTMPEYLKRRFGGRRIQIYMAFMALFVYIFTKISADLYAGALFIEQSLGWDVYPSILLLLGIAAVFTVSGGLTAVMWTDMVQTIIMLVGAIVLMIISFDHVGGLSGLVTKYPYAVPNTTLHSNSTCGYPRSDYMHLFRDPVDGDIPWPGLVGVTINSIWYWCADQVIVQRALAGRTFDHSKMGTILCGYLKVLPLFLLVMPGMIARVLFTETVGCADPDVCQAVCGSRMGCSNIAYPVMVINLLPPGARGMMLAVMMSALMSSLTSIFNSSSTIFALDVWIYIRKTASELETMIVGRVFVLILVVISIIWIPVLKVSEGSQLYVYIQAVASFLQPPICAVFLLGIFWERFNEKGAFFALLAGTVVGLIRFALQYSYTVPECGSMQPDPTPAIVKNVHYLYFSSLLFVITILFGVVITLFTQPVHKNCIQRLTWWSRHSKLPCWDINAWSLDPDGYTAAMKAKVHSVGIGETSNEMKELNTLAEISKLGKNQEILSAEQGVPNADEGILSAEQQVPNTMDATTAEEKEMVHDKIVQIDDKHYQKIGRGPSGCRCILLWMCGVEEKMSVNSLVSHSIQQQDMMSIKQSPRWCLASSIMTVILLIITIIILGLFG